MIYFEKYSLNIVRIIHKELQINSERLIGYIIFLSRIL